MTGPTAAVAVRWQHAAVDDGGRRARVIESLRLQARGPEPLYAVLLERLADDVEASGDSRQVFEVLADLRAEQNVALRVLGAAHRLALSGRAPEYAQHLPTCGGDADAEAAWPALRDLCASGALDEEAQRPVQTNEPARTAALVPGFATIAAETGLPLRLLEVGASAGLLLRFDRYRIVVGEAAWGDPGSPVQIEVNGEASLGDVEVASRRGCDPEPLDPADDRLLLLSFIWPTQVDRFLRLEAALALAASNPVTVDRSSAAPWLERQLADPVEGAATVVYHSMVWQYIEPEEQDAVRRTIHGAGLRATGSAPLVWLRYEPHRKMHLGAELRLMAWPGGADRSLALCGYHGDPVRWGPAPP